MKICIPTNDDAGHSVAEHFGRAPFLTMLDVASGNAKVVRNPGCHSHSGECHHIPILEAHGVEAVVCSRVGRRASSNLRASGIEVLAAPAEASVEAIFAGARAGELRPATVSGGSGGRCGREHGHAHHHRHRHGPGGGGRGHHA
jgi:predicted Fe-Mo cluster-binding NifX family protein